MRRKKHLKPMIDQHRMWRTEGIVGLNWEPVISTGMSATMVMMRMWKRRNMHCMPMMDQCRMWRTEGVTPLVLQEDFRDHIGSLDNPNMDTQSELINITQMSSLDQPSGSVHLLVMSSLPYPHINKPMTVIEPSAVKIVCIFMPVLVV